MLVQLVYEPHHLLVRTGWGTASSSVPYWIRATGVRRLVGPRGTNVGLHRLSWTCRAERDGAGVAWCDGGVGRCYRHTRKRRTAQGHLTCLCTQTNTAKKRVWRGGVNVHRVLQTDQTSKRRATKSNKEQQRAAKSSKEQQRAREEESAGATTTRTRLEQPNDQMDPASGTLVQSSVG